MRAHIDGCEILIRHCNTILNKDRTIKKKKRIRKSDLVAILEDPHRTVCQIGAEAVSEKFFLKFFARGGIYLLTYFSIDGSVRDGLSDEAVYSICV